MTHPLVRHIHTTIAGTLELRVVDDDDGEAFALGTGNYTHRAIGMDELAQFVAFGLGHGWSASNIPSPDDFARLAAPVIDRHGVFATATLSSLFAAASGHVFFPAKECAREHTTDTDARLELAKRVVGHCERLRDLMVKKRALTLQDAPSETPAFMLGAEYMPASLDGMLAADAVLADFLEAIGADGKEAAKALRENARQRWKEHAHEPKLLWKQWSCLDTQPPLFVATLVKVVWRDEVKPWLERQEAHRPAVPRVVLVDRLLQLMTGQTVIPEFDDGAIRNDRGQVVGRIALTTNASLEIVRRGADLFGTVPGQKLVKTLVLRAFDAKERGDTMPNRVAFKGGMEALLENLGVNHNYGDRIRDIARAGACIEWTTPHMHAGGLWTWSEKRGGRGSGEVAFMLGDALLPGFANKLKDAAFSHRVARRLVPELRHDPPMAGTGVKSHGAIWVYHRLLMLELVDLAEEIAESGFAEIGRERQTELAKLARLSPQLLDRVMGGFLEGDDQAPALLMRDGQRDAWTLADQHRWEREFITQAGHARRTGRRKGRAGVERKRRKHG